MIESRRPCDPKLPDRLDQIESTLAARLECETVKDFVVGYTAIDFSSPRRAGGLQSPRGCEVWARLFGSAVR
jgi:hypothetical protein